MSRKKGPVMIDIRNQGCIEKMSDCEVQEEVHFLLKPSRPKILFDANTYLQQRVGLWVEDY